MNNSFKKKLIAYLKKPAVVHLAFLFCALFVWGQALNYISEKHLWSLFGGRLDGYAAHLSQAVLLKTNPHDHFDYMVIGDGLFIKRMAASLPKDKKTLYLKIPQLDLRDVKKVFSVTRRVQYERAFVQDSPFLWSNLLFRGYGPEFNVWTFRIRQATQGFQFIPKSGIKLFFDILTQWAGGPPQDQVLDYSRPSLTGLSFRQPKLRLRKKTKKKVYWVYDTAQIDKDTNPELVKRHRKWRRAAGRDGDLGKFVTFRFVKKLIKGN